MLNIKKAAHRIKHDGLFTFIYNEMRELSKKSDLTIEEVLELLHKHPKFLEDYKELNTQSEISNIQIKEQPISKDDTQECKKYKAIINKNIPELIALEAFEKPADSMIYTVWIGSLVAFLIFVVHNLIVLYTFWYEHYKYYVFASYGILIVGGYLYYKKMIKKHQIKHQKFLTLRDETKDAIQKGLSAGCFKEEDIYE